jgi:hypothetical protein
MKPRLIRFRAVATVWMLFFLSSHARGQESVVENIFSAWEKRQERIDTAAFHFTDNYTFIPTGRTKPVTVRQSESLFIDASKISFRITAPEGNGFVSPEYHGAFDGVTARAWTQLSSHSSGSILSKNRSGDINKFVLKPLLWWLRPTRADIGQLIMTDFVAEPPEVIDGHRCLVIRSKFNRPEGSKFWIDPNRGYVILRWIVQPKGNLRLDIRYEESTEHGWIPTSWKGNWVNEESGAVVSYNEVRVDRYVLNEPIEADEFIVQFPNGTHVWDEATNARYITGSAGLSPYWISAVVVIIGLALWCVYARRNASYRRTLGRQ